MSQVIFGCGDVGRRIAKTLIRDGVSPETMVAYVRTASSAEMCSRLGVMALRVDLDKLQRGLIPCHGSELYYTVAPPKHGTQDLRTEALLAAFSKDQIRPSKVVVISTTGVYGDCDGDWVTEQTPTKPGTERGQRRLDMEQRWLSWGHKMHVPVVILRVPGIYAYSRLPRERIKAGIPVVKRDECGHTNRIHADDLARVCVAAMLRGKRGDIYNVTDGQPGSITEYLQAAAHILGHDPLPEISMQEAHQQLSAGMLSYLSESRKISNQKMLTELGVELKYPNFLQGIKY